MHNIEELSKILKLSFKWHGARLDFLAKFLVALFIARSVNLTKIAEAFVGAATIDSHYKRLQRFFKNFELDFVQITRFVLNHFPMEEGIIIAMDRTNWKVGKKNINFLTLALVYKGVAIPLMWTCLDKQGNSNTKERIAFFKRFFEVIDREQIVCLLADREFIGEAWFDYIINQIPVRIRVKKDTKISNSRGILVNAFTLFRNLKPGEIRVLSGIRQVYGHPLYVVGLKQADGEYVIIATTDSPKTALEDYSLRWNIETLFGCLKSRGFNLEDTHMTDLNRLEKLMGLLTIAFCWVLLTGEWRFEQKPIRIGKHGRYVKSVFRYGLEHMKNVFINASIKLDELLQIFSIILPRAGSPEFFYMVC